MNLPQKESIPTKTPQKVKYLIQKIQSMEASLQKSKNHNSNSNNYSPTKNTSLALQENQFIDFLDESIDKILTLINPNYKNPSPQKSLSPSNPTNYLSFVQQQKLILEKKLLEYRSKQLKQKQLTLESQKQHVQQQKQKIQTQEHNKKLNRKIIQLSQEISFQNQKICHLNQEIDRLVRLNQSQHEEIQQIKIQRKRAQEKYLQLEEQLARDGERGGGGGRFSNDRSMMMRGGSGGSLNANYHDLYSLGLISNVERGHNHNNNRSSESLNKNHSNQLFSSPYKNRSSNNNKGSTSHQKQNDNSSSLVLRIHRFITNITPSATNTITTNHNHNHSQIFTLKLPVKLQINKIVYGIKIGIQQSKNPKQIKYYSPTDDKQKLFLYENIPMLFSHVNGSQLKVEYLTKGSTGGTKSSNNSYNGSSGKKNISSQSLHLTSSQKTQTIILSKYKVTRPEIVVLLYGKGDSIMIDESI